MAEYIRSPNCLVNYHTSTKTPRPKRSRSLAAAWLFTLLLGDYSSAEAQPNTPGSSEAGQNWPTYHGSPGATHYSPLKQINTENVARLQVAWTYDSGDSSGTGWSEMEGNPLIIGGRLIFVSPRGRIICLDAGTGKKLWAFDPTLESAPSRPVRSRGVAYWSEGHDRRILFTYGQYLLALDFESGSLIRDFGSEGRVDLREGLGRDPNLIFVNNVTPGVVYRDLLILGSTGSTPGDVRAYDVHSGKIRWTFHTIPHPGEVGYETWPKDAWRRSFGANVWAGLTLDQAAGAVFLPIASGGMGQKDFYGADRLGDNLFANCLVALDASTGKLRWYFQTVRHDLWDRDLPAQPTLVTVRREGKSIPAVAQVTKSGFIFVLNRLTGQSLYPLEERPVPPSDIPGEVAAASQITPREPAPLTRQRMTINSITQRTPEAHDAVAKEFATLRSRGQFDPPSLQGTVIFPGFDGGAEWGGAAYDPQTGFIYVNANEMAWISKLKPRPQAADGSSGRALYLTHCAGCHRDDLRGSPPEFPSLVNIRFRLSQSEVQKQVREGRGRMPGFGYLPSDLMSTLVHYVFTGIDDVSVRASMHSELATPLDTLQGNGTEAFVFDGYTRLLDPDGYPAVTPPWGTLSAIDVNTGRYAWKIPFGEYPELAAKGLRNTGSENYGGAVVTAGGLLFIGATVYDNKFHAFDKRTGALLWEAELPAAGIASPSTYMVGDRQFVVIGAGGGKNVKGRNGGSIVAFALARK